MLDKIGRALVIFSILGSICVWSFFPGKSWAGTVNFAFLALLPVGAAIWFFYSLEKIGVWMKKRSTQYVLSMAVMAVMSLVILGFLNWGSVYLTEKSGWKKDFTKNHLYSLSSQTLQVLGSLKENVKIELWTSNVQGMGEARDVRTFLDSYQGASKGKLKVEIINPQARFSEAVKANIHRNNIFVIKAEGSGREIRVENFTEKKGEEQLTNAILSATKGQKKIVCFLAGFGGPSLEGKEADSLSFLKEALTSSAYEAKEVALGSVEKVPDECELMALVAPRGAPTDRDLKLIRDKMNTGLPMVAFLGAESPPAWKNFAKDLGVTVREDIVLSPLRPQTPQVVDTANYSRDVEIVKGFRLRTTHIGVSTLALPTQVTTGDVTVKAFVSTEPMAFAKKIDLKKTQSIEFRKLPSDLSGAMPIAALVEKKIDAAAAGSAKPKEEKPPTKINIAPPKHGRLEAPKKSWEDYLVSSAYAQEDMGMSMEQEKVPDRSKKDEKKLRLILFSSDLFLTNALIEQGGNRDLALNSIAYLLQDTDALGIHPRESGEVKLDIKPFDDRKVFGALFILSLLFVTMGIRTMGRKNRLKVA